MLSMPASALRGQQLHELTLVKALQRLDPSIHVDMGAALNIWHPKINRWQGVFRAGKHIGAMSRGFLPEYNLYREVINDGVPDRAELLEVGWRTTIENIARYRLPGLSAYEICRELGVDYKKFTGDPNELSIPDKDVEPIYNTLG
jgi:hypothetical protein